MSGLGATVQNKVRLLRFSPETWAGGVPGHAHHLAVLLEMMGLSIVHHPRGMSQSLASSVQELPVWK